MSKKRQRRSRRSQAKRAERPGDPQRSIWHHYVPQFTLRGFAHNSQLTVHDLLERKQYGQSVKRSAADTDYNTLRLASGDESDLAEREIAHKIETPAAPVLKRIASGGWFETTHERTTVAYFITYQYLRVPQSRAWLNALADQTMKLDMAAGGPARLREIVERSEERILTNDEAGEYWASVRDFDDYSISLPREYHVVEGLKIMSEFAPVLLGGYDWHVVRFRRRKLLTSDAPVLLVPGPGHQSWRGVGLLNAGSVEVAISRQCALILINRADTGLPDGFEIPPTTALAHRINRMTTVNASRYVYHHPNDDMKDLVGEFELPTPSVVSVDDNHSIEVREKLAAMGEMVFDNPGMQHPLANMPVIEPPPDARPPSISP